MIYKHLAVVSCVLFSNLAFAETAHREHGAHQHGVAQLTVALSQQEVEVELHTPAYNILGFEHAPNTEQQQQLVAQQFAVLNQPTDLLNWNTACQLESAAIESPFEVETHHNEHGEAESTHHHDEAEHHDHHEHGETEHQHHDAHHETESHDTHHDKHQETAHNHHNHDEHDEAEHKETHSDIAVVYHYHCQSTPTALDIKGLLTHFPNFETLNVQWVNDTQQSASVLSADKTQVQFK